MGNGIAKRPKQWANTIFKSQSLKFLILGLDGSGKTTLLYRQKFGATAFGEDEELRQVFQRLFNQVRFRTTFFGIFSQKDVQKIQCIKLALFFSRPNETNVICLWILIGDS